MKKMDICLMFILTILNSHNLIAQEKTTIYGIVTEIDGRPLPYVNVYILNSNNGSTTDVKGKFSFKTDVQGESTITASMIGFKNFKQKLYLKNQKTFEINVILEKEIIKLRETIVVGSSFGTEKSKGVVLSSKDVYTTPGGAADIFQSLKTLPGLTQVSESAQLFVRGGDPTETITMVDGATLYHPYTYESAYGGLFSNLNTNVVKGIYFSSGGFSTKYGNALSGVLEIETKDEPINTNYLLGISMAAASINGEITLIDDKFGIRFTSQQSFTKPIMWFNGSLDKFTTTPSSQDLSLSLIYKYSNSGKIKLFGLYAEDKQGVNIDRAEYDGVFNGNSTNNFLNIRHTDILSSNLLIKSSLSFNYHSNKWKLGILDFQQTDDVYKIRSDIEFQISNNLKFVSGLEFEQRERNYLGTIPEVDYDIRPEAISKNIDAKIGNYRLGGYAELEITSLFGYPKLFLVGGSRMDAFPKLNIRWLDPRAGIGYKLSEKSTVKLAFGIFHQLPDLRLLSTEDGNSKLQSMRANHIILSYDFQIDKFNSLRIEAYYKNYSNLPLEDDKLNYNNNGEGFANGIDFIAKGKLPIGFEGWLSYGLINTKRRWMDYEKLSNSDFDITHNLSVILNYRLSSMWKLGVNYKFATGRPHTPIISSTYNFNAGVYEPTYGINNSERFPNYHRLDFRVTHLNQIFNKYFTVFYLEALNILDITNLFGYSYNEDYSKKYKIKSYFGRRTIVLGAQMSF